MALHGRAVAGDHLADEHAFELVLRLGADHGSGGGQVLAVALLLVGVGNPKRIEGLVGEELVEVVTVGTAQLLELGLCRPRQHDLDGARRGPALGGGRHLTLLFTMMGGGLGRQRVA